MSSRDFIQLFLFLGILILSAKPLGIYLESVYTGSRHFLTPLLGGVEKLVYRLAGVDPEEDQNWKTYTLHLLVFSFFTCLLTFLILLFQHKLPLNPQGLPGLSWHLALNTAVSFTTNTNWQAYGGESTMSYFSQMVGLTFHNFISAAVGMAAAVALIRGIARKQAKGIGNFWADLVRANLYILLPISFIFAIFLVSQGMIQNFYAYTEATTLEGLKQTIAQGPVASQVAIKMLGTNGGGFFNANAAHPFENPTPLSNFIQMLSIFLIPSALVYLLGRMTGNKKHAWAVWATMAIIFIAGGLICAKAEYAGSSVLHQAGLASAANMEGKEVRFGVFNSALFATITTDASCGAVNSMHDSFTPIGGIVPLVNILFGEIIFGGVGAGLYGMLLFILLTIFITGLMVGRTPEYLGKKIEASEVKLVMIAVILMALSILSFTAYAAISPLGLAGLNNSGPHGLSEIFYAYASATGNNGSAFAGLTASTPFYDVTLAIAMLIGRFGMMIPVLALAGSLVRKKIHPGGEAAFPVHGWLFVAILIGIIILVGALTFFPVLTLSPIVEHLEMGRGSLF
ncbi:MAG: potassium-transporting ATPase subunit KdpA [Deltaproteobacteria bacterium]|nr:potassium-transporting ATPase subunit KdpA [Deltaproteobacteria bacterium]